VLLDESVNSIHLSDVRAAVQLIERRSSAVSEAANVQRAEVFVP